MAVATQSVTDGAAPAELVVFDVPAFTAKFTARSGRRPTKSRQGFTDLAWAADGKALYAIDDPGAYGEKAAVRRWAVPDFADSTTTELERKLVPLRWASLTETVTYCVLFYFWVTGNRPGLLLAPMLQRLALPTLAVRQRNTRDLRILGNQRIRRPENEIR